jgi:hypothetical protein
MNDNTEAEMGSIYYQEFSVDTTVYSNDTVFYDVDDDGVLDLAVSRFIEIENSMAEFSGDFNAINEPMEFCFITYNPLTSMLEPGDEINANANLFEWQPAISYMGTTGVLNEDHYWAQGIFTDYFGFKYNSDQGVLFGWLRFKHFELAEMAINTNPNAPILVGQTE